MSAIAIQRTTFSTSRTLEFCSAKELIAQSGHEPADWSLVILKELIDNAVDACEEAGIAPAISVTIARGIIRVRDNGPGLPADTVASILDFTTRTSSREAYVAPDRGRQGNALKLVVAMPFALSDGESLVEIAAHGICHRIAFRFNRVAQRPVVDHQQHVLNDAAVRIGTAITVHWPDSACSVLESAAAQFLPLVASFTDLNPHLSLRVTCRWRGLRYRRAYEASDTDWAKWTPSAPTSPHWYRAPDFERLAGAFLSHDRARNTVRVMRDFLTQFDGLSGSAKRKAVLEEVGLQRASMDRLLVPGRDEFDHDLVRRLLMTMKATARPIKPKALGPIGQAHVAASLEAWGAVLGTFRYKVLIGTDFGVPWLVEAAMACRPPGDPRRLLFGINWSPGLGDPFQLGYQLGSYYCGPGEPIVLFVHVICPRPEFLDRGKRTLAYHSPGYGAIKEAVEAVTATWAKQRRSEIRDQARELKRMDAMRSSREQPKLSLKELVTKYLPAVIKSTSQDGHLSFTQRDLFYALRPLVQAEHDKPLDYGYFTSKLLTDYENEQADGEIVGLQREARGSLYHPHLRQWIPLSTESVAAYSRPFWTFNKLMVIEKSGTQQNLVETGWPEEHDCGVASAVGFTTRAVKDLLDMLASSDEPLTVFCVHDADAAGTMIYHTLVSQTKARRARKITVINLGLEPWEGVAMGLEIEPVEKTDKRRAVAPYVAEHDRAWEKWLNERGFGSWEEWLQRYRIELNAMPPAQRIAWLTEKIERYPPRKVVPPADVLHQSRIEAARQAIREELTKRARIEERTEKLVAKMKWPDSARLPKLVARLLDRAKWRRAHWATAMAAAGRKLARRIAFDRREPDEVPF